MVRTRVGLGLVTLAWGLLAPAAWAQQASGIAGVVKDTSGAVLPGVTVEAASPALIEKVRSVVSDGEGRYNIVNLLPGTYAVTFTLAGFKPLKREGIALTSGFTATVNADLQVGSLEETVTVTGETPLVDTSNVRKQTLVSSDLLNVLPTSTKHWATIVEVTPGFAGSFADVAGQLNQNLGNSYHGKTGTKRQYDGMGIDHASGNIGYIANSLTVEEVSLQTSGISAESGADGAIVNLISKDGGNTFSGSLEGLYTNDSLETSNLNDLLRARGLTTVSKILKVYDAGVTLGGPFRKDKLWFFGSLREWGNGHLMAGNFWNKTQGAPIYTPDYSRPGDRFQWYESKALRVTWQASQKNKFSFFADVADDCLCRAIGALGSSPEAGLAFHFRPTGLYQTSWSAPLSTKLLVDAGASLTITHWPTYLAPGVSPNDISILELLNNYRYNASATYADKRAVDRGAQRFSVSYVTGSHAFKGGIQIEEAVSDINTYVQGDVNYSFRNGVPTQITQYASPYRVTDRTGADMGLFAQDQWSIHRLTLNYGLRYEYFYGYVPALHEPATPSGWIPARDFAKVSGAPSWKDWSPRLGVAYDLFGNSKTALKISMGRYVVKTGTGVAAANDPVATSVLSVTRTWTDTNGNYVPDCNLANFGANGECAGISNTNFGQNNPNATRYADAAIHGWGIRGNNWDFATEVQHQLSRAVSVTAGYYRNWYGNFLATDNQLVTPADFSPYCITSPVNAALPNGGGYQVCGAYDVSLAKFGQVTNLITQASNYGKQSQVNDFFNVSLNTRFASGIRLGGGIDTGRMVTDNCFVVDSPQQLLNCHVAMPFKGQTQIKLNGSLPLPYNFVVSGIYQDVSGINSTANYVAANSELAASLGRNLASCGTRTPCTGTAMVPLIAPGILFEPRIRRLDLRLTKLLRVGPNLRLQANFDLYNAFNGSGIVQEIAAYGTQWRQPTEVQDPRIVQFSANITF